MKKFMSAMLALVLVFSCTSAAFAVDEGVDTLSATPMGEAEIEEGFEDAEVIVISVPVELISVTEEIEPLYAEGTLRAEPDRHVTKTFKYTIRDGADIYNTGVEVTVDGTYSRTNNYAQIDKVTVRITNSNSEVTADRPYYDRNTATVRLKVSNFIIRTFTYEISPTGIISDISSKQDT